MSVRRCAVLTAVSVVLVGLAAGSSTATFSGTDGRISFNRVVGNSLQLFSANPDGSDVQKLTDTPKNTFSVITDWSPNGQLIAFDSDRTDLFDGRKGGVQIYVMNADGSGVTQLTRGPGFHGFPGWSPDGASMAISADWGDRRELEGVWIIPATDPDGVTVNEAQRVTENPPGEGFDDEPQISPDGTRIVFTRFKSARRSAIHTVNVDGSGLERVTKYDLNASDPDWSPDGTKITFDSGDSGQPGVKGDIYVINPDGSGRKRLTDNKELTRNSPFVLSQNPVFSPSGEKIMFTQFRENPERNELRVMNPDGSAKRAALRIGGFPNKADWGTHP